MSSQLTILLFSVGAAVIVLLGINLYVLFKPKKQEPDDTYLALHQRLDSFSQLISDQLEKNRQASEKATVTVHQQVQGFTQGMTLLQENMRQMHESVKGVVSFQDIFKSPKLRGIWGEASLESALD